MKQVTIFLIYLLSLAVTAQIDSTTTALIGNHIEQQAQSEYDERLLFDYFYATTATETELNKLQSEKVDFYAFLDDLQGRSKKKKGKKKLEFLYKEIWSEYFVEENTSAKFCQLIRNGSGNSITRLAVLMLAAEHLSLDYSSYFIAGNYVLTVEYDDEMFIWEPTEKLTPIPLINRAGITEHRDYLLTFKPGKMGILLDDDFMDIYYDYYEKINLRELLGLFYYFESVNLSMESQWEKATAFGNLALHHFDEHFIKLFQLQNVINLLLVEEDQVTEQTCSYRQQIINLALNEKYYSRSLIASYEVKSLQLIRNADAVPLESDLPSCLIEGLKDQDLINKVNNEIYLQLAYLQFQLQDYDKALALAEKTQYKDKIRNRLFIKDIIKGLLFKNFSSMPDPTTLTDFVGRFPFIIEDQAIRTMLVSMETKKIQDLLDEEDLDAALALVSQIADSFKDKSFDSYGQELIGQGFGQISRYYILQRDLESAKEIIEIGLESFPDNKTLLRKLKVLED